MPTELTLKVSADTKGIREINAVLDEMKRSVGSASSLSKGFKKLEADSQILKTGMLSLTATVEKMDISLGKLSRKQVVAAATTKGFASSLRDKLNPALKKTTASTTSFRDSVRGAAAAGGSLWMAYGALLPLMGAFVTVASAVKGVSLAADFEAQTVYMNAVAEASGDYSVSLQGVQKELLGLKGLTHAPADLAVASKELVKAGFSTTASISEIADMSRTATVAQEGLILVTKGVAKQFRAWGAETMGVERGVSSLKQTAEMMSVAALATTTDFSELNAMLAHTTELGPLTGASFSEVLAALGHMSNMGISGTKAATSLRTAFLRLENITPTLAKKMQDLKVPFSAFNKDGDFKDLTTLFDDLGLSLASLSTKARIEAINDVFGLRSLKGGVAMLGAMSKAIGEGSFSFRELEEQISSAGKSLEFIGTIYDKLGNTTKQKMAIMKAEISGTLIEAFNDSNGAVSDLIDTITELNSSGGLKTIIDGLASITKFMIKLVEQAVIFKDELIIMGGLYLFAKMTTGVLTLTGTIHGVTAAQLLFNAAVSLNPYILLGAAVAGALVYTGKYILELESIAELTSDISDRTSTMGKSIEGWKAVFAGDLGFFDFATMNDKELAEYRAGTDGLEAEIRRKKERLSRLEGIADVQGYDSSFGSELRAEIKTKEVTLAKLVAE
ncbi:MAG: phage tail tape measure protein, partial [Spirochaetales bacterium]|nr:phage tail tape measure protein [Spirochaetales bacterium]